MEKSYFSLLSSLVLNLPEFFQEPIKQQSELVLSFFPIVPWLLMK